RDGSHRNHPAVEDGSIVAGHDLWRHATTDAFHVGDQTGQALHLAGELGTGFVALVEKQHWQASVCPPKDPILRLLAIRWNQRDRHTASGFGRPYAHSGVRTPDQAGDWFSRIATGRT